MEKRVMEKAKGKGNDADTAASKSQVVEGYKAKPGTICHNCKSYSQGRAWCNADDCSIFDVPVYSGDKDNPKVSCAEVALTNCSKFEEANASGINKLYLAHNVTPAAFIIFRETDNYYLAENESPYSEYGSFRLDVDYRLAFRWGSRISAIQALESIAKNINPLTGKKETFITEGLKVGRLELQSCETI